MKRYGYFCKHIFTFVAFNIVLNHAVGVACAEDSALAPKATDVFKPPKSPKAPIKNYRNYGSTGVMPMLGWVSDPKAGACQGYYLEPIVNPYFLPKGMDKTSPVQIKADSSALLQQGTSILTGNVSVEQGDQQLKAEKMSLYRNQAGGIETADLVDHVTLREPGKLFLSDKATINFNEKTALLNHVLYRLSFTKKLAKGRLQVSNTEEIKLAALANLQQLTDTELTRDDWDLQDYSYARLEALNAWGYADKIVRKGDNYFHMYDTTYSTCPSAEPAWQIKAEQLELDREKGRGYAKHVYLNLKDVPILYFPYFNFPIDQRRNSGFLFPTMGLSTDSGADISVPYYFNLAPNYDLVLIPRYLSDRGVMLGGKFRYLTDTHQGGIRASFLPDDRAFREFKEHARQEFASSKPLLLARLKSQNDNRALFSFDDTSILNAHFTFTTNFNWVSDDYYFQDLGNSYNTISQNQLEQRADLIYRNEHWDILGRVQRYQTLHPINQPPITELYRRAPQLLARGEYPNSAYGLDYHVLAEWANFDIRRNPGEPYHKVVGQRLFTQSGARWKNEFSGGYVTPAVYLHGLHYVLDRPEYEPGSSQPSLLVPILNIDAGMKFDRNIDWLSHAYTQTLEPRLFYLFVPFRSQVNFPIFDTTIQPFNFDHLFRLNRFDGFDRINDANQVTLALTSRFLDAETGNEKFRAGLGQIFYFRDRNVQLCSTHDCNDEDNPTLVAVTPNTNSLSPLVGEVMYQMDSAWSLRTQLAWNIDKGEVNNGNFYLSYQPSATSILNLGYVFIRDGDALNAGPPEQNLSQADISFTTSLTEQWSALGRFNYNIGHHYMHTALLGLQYDTCCWALRVMANRTYKNLNENNNPEYDTVYYVQWLLKGLGSLGSGNPGSYLTEGIPQYKDPFDV